MIKFAVVGTNWISEEFVASVKLECRGQLTSVFSRNEKTGREFAKKNGIEYVYTDYEKMLESDDVDAVYIASPNAIHFGQALLAVQKGKHVICEKAITSNGKELAILLNEANNQRVLVIEAMKSIAMPTFETIKKQVESLGNIRKVVFNFCQYSSRYDALKSGEVPNIFNPNLSAGALMDIGIYCIYPCIALFGMPKKIMSQVTMLETGVDGGGTLILEYEGFEAVLLYSKINNSFIPSEIMGEKGSLIIHHISSPDRVEKVTKKESEVVSPNTHELAMRYEIEEFIDTLECGTHESKIYTHELMRNVMAILDQVREDHHIVFPADYN